MMNPIPPVSIHGRPVGMKHPVYVIAEAGINHNGDMDLAREMICAASWAGADAVKFQSFRAHRLVAPTVNDFDFRRQVELDAEQQAMLAQVCKNQHVDFLSTPFDEETVDLLVELGAGALKIASFDITHYPLLEKAASTGLPLLLSTGASTLDDVRQALEVIQRTRQDAPVVLLHCVSQYPADWSTMNLSALLQLREQFGAEVGLSDHTLELNLASVAVACGACVVEKHFTLDVNLDGPDQQLSLEPEFFSTMVCQIRAVHAAMGHVEKKPLPGERDLAVMARRSLHTCVDVPAGTELTRDMIDILRPATGLPPAALDEVVGTVAEDNIPAWTPLTWDLLKRPVGAE